MARKALLSSVFFALQGSVLAQTSIQTRWGQCGGDNYDGPTVCPDTYHCTVDSRWYAQCVPEPGSPDDTAIRNSDVAIQTTSFPTIVTVTITAGRTPTPSPVVVTTYITIITPRPTPTLTPDRPIITLVPDDPLKPRAAPEVEEKHKKRVEKTKRNKRVPAVAGDPTPSQLKDGQLWIRAVTDPHFHDYLQTNPQNEPGVAIMGPIPSAGQYNIVDGQLISGGSDDVLYLHVQVPADTSAPDRKLATWFNTTANGFGTFEFNGDAVIWTTPEFRRENNAAWLICEGNELFINTGAYGYQTPAGCSDHTIHYYNGATAD